MTNETKRIFKYIAQLKPHRLEDTLELNSLRNTIMLLIKSLADISLNIATNLAVVGQKKGEVKLMTEGEKHLKQKLVVPAVVLISSPLDYPTTVCTSINCVKPVYLPSNVIEYEYVKRCHKHCELKQELADKYPDERLQGCAAIHASSGLCRKCKCSWDVHMHITDKQKRKKSEYLDKAVEKLLNSNKHEREAIEECIRALNERMDELMGEQTVITQTSAKFARFLKEFAWFFTTTPLANIFII